MKRLTTTQVDKNTKPPAAEVFYDEHDLYASREIAKSSNPEAKKISILYRVWYFILSPIFYLWLLY